MTELSECLEILKQEIAAYEGESHSPADDSRPTWISAVEYAVRVLGMVEVLGAEPRLTAEFMAIWAEGHGEPAPGCKEDLQ